MKRAVVLLLVALALPTGVALARSPNAGGKGGGGGQSAPKVQWILQGTLSSYTPVSASGNGQVSVTVKHANYRGRALKNKTLTFTLTAGKSRVTFMRGSHANGQITDGTKGYVVVRAPKRLTGDLTTTLPAAAVRVHVVVLKAPAPTS